MKKIFSLIFVLLLIMTVFSGCRKKTQVADQVDSSKAQEEKGQTAVKKESPVPSKNDKDLAVSKALEIFQIKKSEGVKFENGPCLAEELIPDWVADIAHNPRTETDNLPENQCSAFRRGQAHHFVELDPDGRVIRTM